MSDQDFSFYCLGMHRAREAWARCMSITVLIYYSIIIDVILDLPSAIETFEEIFTSKRLMVCFVTYELHEKECCQTYALRFCGILLIFIRYRTRALNNIQVL
jgi:hypothetical protein